MAEISPPAGYKEMTQEEQIRIQRTFEMMQVPIIKYINYIIQESDYGEPTVYEKIFKLPPIEELKESPIVLEMREDEFIYVTFEIMHIGDDRSNNYRAYIQDEDIWSFMTSIVENGANMVWNYFISDLMHSGQNQTLLKKIKIFLDHDNLTFTPCVIPLAKQSFMIANNMKKTMDDFKNYTNSNGISPYSLLSEKELKDFLDADAEINKRLLKSKMELNDDDEINCHLIEDKLKSMKRLVAQCSIKTKEELPLEMQRIIDSRPQQHNNVA
jgi:hypothetical protein